MFVDAREHIGQPSLRIDAVEARGLDQRVHHRRTLAAYAMFGAQLTPTGLEDDADGPWIGSFCFNSRAYGRAAADRSTA